MMMKKILLASTLGAAMAFAGLPVVLAQAGQLSTTGGFGAVGFGGGIGASFGSGKQKSFTSTGSQTAGGFFTSTNKKGVTTNWGNASTQAFATQTNSVHGTGFSGAGSASGSFGSATLGFQSK